VLYLQPYSPVVLGNPHTTLADPAGELAIWRELGELGSDTICANWGQTPIREFGVCDGRQPPFALIGV